jgi:hypothetical protein
MQSDHHTRFSFSPASPQTTKTGGFVQTDHDKIRETNDQRPICKPQSDERAAECEARVKSLL